MSRTKKLVFTLLAVVLCLLVSSVIAELMLRHFKINATWMEVNCGRYASPYRMKIREPWILDTGVNWKSAFNQQEFNIPFSTNGEGVRDIVHPVKKAKGEFRVVALGDSFTMGQGAELEETWPKVLESLLKEKCGLNARVIMGGVAGSDPVFAYQLLKRRLLKYGPDLIILQFNGSDYNDIIARGGMDRFDGKGQLKNDRGPSYEWLWQYSFLFRLIMIELMDCDSGLLITSEEYKRRGKEVMQIMDKTIMQYQELAKEHKARLLVVLQPHMYQLKSENSRRDFAPFVKKMKDKGIPAMDLYPFFRNKIAPNDEKALREYYWPMDRHFKAKGYSLMASGILEEMARRGYVTKR